MSEWFVRFFALSTASVRAIVRSKMYVGLLALGGALVMLALALAELAVGEMITSLIDLGLAFTSVAICVLTIVNICSNPASNSNPRQVIVIAARPISRSEIVLARYAAVIVLAFASAVVLAAAMAGIVMVLGGPVSRVFLAGVATALEAAVVGAIALALWARFSPTVAITLSFCMFALGRFDQLAQQLIDKGTFGPMTTPASWMARVLPHLSHFDLTAWVHGGPMTPVGWAIAYALIYSAAMLLAAVSLYGRREFT